MGHDDNATASRSDEVHDSRCGRGELNMVSTHLIAEGTGTGIYEPTPLEVGGRVSYKRTRSVDRDS